MIRPAAICAVSLLCGCRVFPYDSHYLCEKTADYGHCTSVEGAYQDALSGSGRNGRSGDVGNGHERDEEASISKASHIQGRDRDRTHAPEIERESASDYRAQQYKVLAGLINAPVAPVLAPPKMLRTLIVAYEDARTSASDLPTLYMPRLVYYVVDQPHFVLSTRFAQTAPGVPMIYPNGAPRDAMRAGDLR